MFREQLRMVALAAAATIILSPLYAFAMGVGFYGSGGYGGGGYSPNDPSRSDLADLSYQKARFGGGFVLDNNVAGQSVFNYRLNLGADAVIDQIGGVVDPVPTTYDFSGVRFNWINNFGFALVRAPGLRWWLGPQQGLFVLNESDAGGSGIFSFDGAVGLVTGLNFNLKGRVSLALDLAVRYLLEIATREKRSPQESFDASYIGNGGEFGLTISFLVRGRDRFRRY